jgi:hypothetical protein
MNIIITREDDGRGCKDLGSYKYVPTKQYLPRTGEDITIKGRAYQVQNVTHSVESDDIHLLVTQVY